MVFEHHKPHLRNRVTSLQSLSMAESPDQSVSISDQCEESQSNPRETRAQLALQSVSEDQVNMKVVGIIGKCLKKLQAAVAAHPQASKRRSYNEKEKKNHEALTAANRIISEILGLIELPQSLSPEKLIDLVNGLTSAIETPDIDVDHVNIQSSVRSTMRRPWWKAGQKKDWGIKAILELIVSLAALIPINADTRLQDLQRLTEDTEKRRLQDLQRLTEETEKRRLQDLQRLTEDAEKRRLQDLQRLTDEKDQTSSRLEKQLLFLESLRYCHTLLSRSKNTTR